MSRGQHNKAAEDQEKIGMTATEIRIEYHNLIKYHNLIAALNTCAIGGNQFARKKLALLKDDPAGFAEWAEKFLSHKAGLGSARQGNGRVTQR